MNQLQLFLPCAAGVEDYLAHEVARITGQPLAQVQKWRAGVLLQGSWRDAMLLNLHSRLAQRVLVQLFQADYRNEQDLYRAASEVAWEIWFTPRQSDQGRGHRAAQPADQPELCRAEDQGCGLRPLPRQGRRRASRRRTRSGRTSASMPT